MQTQVEKDLIQNAIDAAKLLGILNYLPNGKLTHTPFSISPYTISESDLGKMTILTTYFNELMINVSNDWNFLEHYLKPISKKDSFLKLLLDFRNKEITQSKQLLVQRNDFFLEDCELKNLSKLKLKKSNFFQKSSLKHVEINTISASFPYLISQLNKLHKFIFEKNKIDKIIHNNPIYSLANTLAKANKDYGFSDSTILFVTQPGERNRFDQIGLEKVIWDLHKIPTVKKSFSEIYENGYLRDGHLILDEKIVSVTYYRAGYSPEDFIKEDSKKGRRLIEASSTIQAPNLSMQLSGMKKIQQILTIPEILSKYTSMKGSNILKNTFVKMYSLEELLDTDKSKTYQTEINSKNLNEYVLKPQREGGGNNLFGNDIADFLSNLNTKNKNLYVLMERIMPKTHDAILIVEGKATKTSCVSEIGRYGICFADDDKIKLNNDIGYLVRTKSEKVNEGGVCSGYACLNSLKLE